ncbi:MAG TPA: DUF5069 domain-containing protein [Candidatus Cybelea sp.]|nr:DUF5069 domain-containing protein [Candidatus Cybelea sp.]
MPTDFRDGKTFPRRGREPMGDALWLLRLSDKARAHLAGTIHDYIYPCPMDQGVMERWKVTRKEFEEALVRYPTDDLLHAWLRDRVAPQDIQRANNWLLKERVENLDRQDAEEVATVERR